MSKVGTHNFGYGIVIHRSHQALPILIFVALAISHFACRADIKRQSDSEEPELDVSGVWVGQTNADIPFRFALKFEHTNGGWMGTVLCQSWRTTMPLESVRLRSSRAAAETQVLVDATVGGLPNEFGGCTVTLRLRNNQLIGTCTRGGRTENCILERARNRDPFPKALCEPQRAFIQRSVTYRSANVLLSGTVTLPSGHGPFPAILLINGSREDEDVNPGDEPRRLLAEYLARSGIISLRADDRGIGKSTGDFRLATLDDLADDALAGVSLLKTLGPGMVKDVGILGASQGGLAAALAVQRSTDVHFLILLSTPGVRGDEVALAECANRLRRAGFSEKSILDLLRFRKQLLAASQCTAGTVDERRIIASMIRESDPDATPAELRHDVAVLETDIANLRKPRMQRFLSYDPRNTLKRIQIPVLSISGSMDELLNAERDCANIRSALKDAGNEDATTVILPGVDHYLGCSWAGPAIDSWGCRSAYSPEVIDGITKWILDRFESQ